MVAPPKDYRIDKVVVTLKCPSCGAEDYEVDLDGDEVAQCTQVSIPCDECPDRIVVDVEVQVQIEKPKEGP